MSWLTNSEDHQSRQSESYEACKHGVPDSIGNCQECTAEALQRLEEARRLHAEAQQKARGLA